jgi:RimJ/RimL family protein N-acetyltransferase
MSYKCLKKNVLAIDNYSIVPFRQKDLYLIKDWRNIQMDILRQEKVLTSNDQDLYFANYISPAFSQKNPKQILFSYLLNDECIGYGGLTNIAWKSKRAELSYLVNPTRTKPKNLYGKEFSIFISMIKKVVFSDLKFNRIYTETFDIRPFHILILEKNGFKNEGRLRQHSIIKGKLTDSIIHGFLKEENDL